MDREDWVGSTLQAGDGDKEVEGVESRRRPGRRRTGLRFFLPRRAKDLGETKESAAGEYGLRIPPLSLQIKGMWGS